MTQIGNTPAPVNTPNLAPGEPAVVAPTPAPAQQGSQTTQVDELVAPGQSRVISGSQGARNGSGIDALRPPPGNGVHVGGR